MILLPDKIVTTKKREMKEMNMSIFYTNQVKSKFNLDYLVLFTISVRVSKWQTFLNNLFRNCASQNVCNNIY